MLKVSLAEDVVLEALHIQNFIRVRQLSIDLASGMTVITGESGAGKSLLLSALALCAGERAGSGLLYPGAAQAAISAEFDLRSVPAALAQLSELGFAADADDAERCTIRRVLSSDGRSRAFINSQPAKLADLQALTACLLDIHAQDARQALLEAEHQRQLLDSFAGCSSVEIAQVHSELKTLQQERARIASEGEQVGQRLRWLNEQIAELEAAGIVEGEIKELEREHKLLENVEALTADTHEAQARCSGEGSAYEAVGSIQRLLSHHSDDDLQAVCELLDSALINLDEASSALRRFAERLEQSPERLQQVRTRLEQIYDYARKYEVTPDDLPSKLLQCQQERDSLQGAADLGALDERIEKLIQQYDKQDAVLHKARTAAAKTLQTEVNQRLQQLFMQDARFEVQLEHSDTLQSWGRDRAVFCITTHPDAPADTLASVASGGEFSRISLAIKVVCAQHALLPTLVFDEVDTGVGGRIAEVVGLMLRELSVKVQTICITHQPQVTAQGNQHLLVKREEGEASGVDVLNMKQRHEELSRMLGGLKVTDKARAHAEQMLRDAGQDME